MTHLTGLLIVVICTWLGCTVFMVALFAKALGRPLPAEAEAVADAPVPAADDTTAQEPAAPADHSVPGAIEVARLSAVPGDRQATLSDIDGPAADSSWTTTATSSPEGAFSASMRGRRPR